MEVVETGGIWSPSVWVNEDSLYLCLFNTIALANSLVAYKALQSFEILKLLSKATMKAYTGTFMDAPGASNACTVD